MVPERESQGPLSVAVRDFGPIRRATVDLRPLTVFVGQSNTGKSYLAILIYALHNLFRTTDDQRSVRRSAMLGLSGAPGELPLVPQRKRGRMSADHIRTLVGWMSSVVADRGKLREALPESIIDIVRPSFELSSKSRPLIENEIMRCFGQTDVNDLIRFGSRNGASIEINKMGQSNSEYTDVFSCNIRLKSQGAEIRSSVPNGAQYRIEYGDFRKYLTLVRNVLEASKRADLFPDQPKELRREERILDYYISRFVNTLAHLSLPIAVGPLHTHAHYLPADRTGIMHAHRVVVSALVGSVPTAGLRPAINVSPLSGILTDFLLQLIGLDSSLHEQRLPEDNFGKQIEDRVLNGSVVIDRNDAYPSFSYRPDGFRKNIPLSSSSSMVSELAPVVLYLRHIVQRGDVLIIEEPESHLHPEMQAAFACEISRLVRSGVRVLITTHSELILEQIGNLIRASELPQSSHVDIADSDSVLEPDSVGVWLFTGEGTEQGSIVEEAVLDSDSGLFRVGYGTVREALYNQSALTFNRLHRTGG